MEIHAVEADLPTGIEEAVTPYPPTPLQSLIFYGDDRIKMKKEGTSTFELQPSIVVVGPQYTRVNLMVTKRIKAIRVDFKPGGLYRVLRIPMHELYDAGFNAVEILGQQMEQLNEQILNASNLDAAKNYVEDFLLTKRNKLVTSLPFDEAMFELMKSEGNLSIEKAASIACLSLRQFERKCKERIGMAPKSFARISRFSKAYRLRESNPNLSWTSIAHLSGFFDQMHMIRDFKEFAGVAPTLLEQDLSQTPFRMQANIMK